MILVSFVTFHFFEACGLSIDSIDRLLGGGLRQGQLTEVTGPSSSGKTQVRR
jgi:RecA/RadA recombinase